MSGAAGGGNPGGAAGGLDANQFVAKVVDGLIKNGTPQAWQSVYAVAAGTLKTPVDPAKAAEIVVLELFRNRASNVATIDQILVALIDGTAQIPAESRTACLKTMTTASAAAAGRFMNFASASAPAANNNAGYPGGAGGYPGGAPGGAPGLGGGYPGGAPGGDPGLGEAPGGAPGLGGPPGGGGIPGMQSSMSGMNHAADAPVGPPIPEELITPAASAMWGPKAVAAVAAKLDSATDVASAGDLVLLAATIPNQKVRESMLGLMSRTHGGGAEAFASLGLFDSNMRDPGLLVVLKSLPRQKPARGDDAENQPLDAWSSASRDVVLALRDRLKAASGSLTPAGDDLPLRLHRNATPEVAVMLTLPGAEAGALQDAAPSATKVYYARTSFSPQRARDQTTVLEHYESKSGGYLRPDKARGLNWIDGVKATAGVRRSMDVIIESAGGSSGGGGFGAPPGFGAGDDGAGLGAPGGGRPPGFNPGGASGSYTIEVIVVEIAEPKTTAAGDSQASAAP